MTHRCQGHETSHLYQRNNSYNLRHLWSWVLWLLDFDIVSLAHAEMVYMDFSATDLFIQEINKEHPYSTHFFFFFFQIAALDNKQR